MIDYTNTVMRKFDGNENIKCFCARSSEAIDDFRALTISASSGITIEDSRKAIEILTGNKHNEN